MRWLAAGLGWSDRDSRGPGFSFIVPQRTTQQPVA